MEALPTDVAAGRLPPCVSALVDPQLGSVGELLPAVLAGDAAARGGQLVGRQRLGVFSDDVVLEAAVRLSADGAELALAAVHRPVAAQVIGLREASSARVAPVRSHVAVRQLVPRQVAEMKKALPANVANERLVGVRHQVRPQHAGAGVGFPADVTAARLFAGVPHLHVQVAVSFVVKPFRAVVAGVRQQPVRFYLVLTELQHAGENCPAHRAHRMELPVVVGESFCVRKQPPALGTRQMSHSSRR